MKTYLFSLGAGILVGIIYDLLNVRSPAPPVIALIGLFGILLGEQALPLARRILIAESAADTLAKAECGQKAPGLPRAATQGCARVGTARPGE